MPFKIEVEGADGSGKTTAVNLLADAFQKAGYRTLVMAECGFKKIDVCVKLRQLVLDPASGLSPLSMELLFAAQRLENDIWLKTSPEAEKYDIIISDRGYVSHLAYGYANAPCDKIDILFREVLNDVAKPDIILLMDVSAETGTARIQARRGKTDRIEDMGIEYQRKVIVNYLHILTGRFRKTCHNKGGTILRVDANQELSAVESTLNGIVVDIVKKIEATTY